MAWIKSVTVAGLAGSSKERTIRLNRDVNIFWGPNGCGKTSLLKILHSAMIGTVDELSRVHFKSATVEISAGNSIYTRSIGVGDEQADTLFDQDDDPERTARLSAGERKARARNRTWKTSPPLEEDYAPQFDHRYLPVSRISGPLSPELRFRLSRGERMDKAGDNDYIDQLFTGAIQETWRDYATQELDVIRKIQQRGLADILSAVIGKDEDSSPQPERTINARDASRAVTKFFKSQEIQLPESAIKRLVREYAEDAVLRNVVAEIVEVQEQVDAAQEPTRKIESLIAEMFSGGKQAHFLPGRLVVTLGDRRPLQLMSLSSGEKQLLRLFVECRVAGAGVIIIDEPELSMHVDWQHFLIESMQSINPDAQIIVATHSPEVMARVADEKVFQL